MVYQRDPVSVWFDAGARRLLARAYARRGQWAGTVLADPSPRHLIRLRALGIAPFSRDRPSVSGGTGVNARTRWGRGFVRALYYQHKWYSPTASGRGWSRRTVARHAGALEVEVGSVKPAMGTVPRGRAVRVRIRPGGQAALRAVRRLPESRRIYTDEGGAAARWSDPELRDW